MTANACHVPGCVLAGLHRGRHRSATGQHFDQHQPATPTGRFDTPPPVAATNHNGRPAGHDRWRPIHRPECGSTQGYGCHTRHGEAPCQDCKDAMARHTRIRRRQRLEALG